MNINWFPGHMTKSIRMIDDSIKLTDIVIYVLDARAPYSCMNPQFKKYIANKPVIYVLNKSDLGNKSRVDEWKKVLTDSKSIAVTTVGTASGSASAIVAASKKLCGDKIDKYRLKGIKTSVRAIVLGVPNCGKSTLINCLCNAGKTVTGNKAGVTRGKQWVRVNEYFEVLDTPGTLYPKLTNQTIARRLAFIGSIRDEVTDIIELAQYLVDELNDYDVLLLKGRYGVDGESDSKVFLEKLAKVRGYVLKGGVSDIERAANALLDDFRKGKIGKVTLEKADEYDIGII